MIDYFVDNREYEKGNIYIRHLFCNGVAVIYYMKEKRLILDTEYKGQINILSLKRLIEYVEVLMPGY